MELHRKWLMTFFNQPQYQKKYEWIMIQAQRKALLWKPLTWHAILLTSIPNRKNMRCGICDFKTSTAHFIDHPPSHLGRIVRLVIKLRNKDYGVSELLKVGISSRKVRHWTHQTFDIKQGGILHSEC